MFTELYQELVLDHSRHPRNQLALEAFNAKAEGYNPLCGDRVTVFLKIEDDRIKDASFTGQGCAISTAAASLMTETLKGKTVGEARRLSEIFRAMVTGGLPVGEQLGKLKVFAGVAEFPSRVKCATLPWHTLVNALNHESKTAVTE